VLTPYHWEHSPCAYTLPLGALAPCLQLTTGSTRPGLCVPHVLPTQHAANLYLDLRPFMNRAPFTIRTDCSAARAHQVGSHVVRPLHTVCREGALRCVVSCDDGMVAK